MDRRQGRGGCTRTLEIRASASARARKGPASAHAKPRRRSRTCTRFRPRRRPEIPSRSRRRAASGDRRDSAPSRSRPPDSGRLRSGERPPGRAGAQVRKVAPPETRLAPMGVARSTNWKRTVIRARLPVGGLDTPTFRRAARRVKIESMEAARPEREIRRDPCRPSRPSRRSLRSLRTPLT